MRDPERIKVICDRLKAVWSTCPDLRLGQMMEIVRHKAESGATAALFYMEDEELMRCMEDLLYHTSASHDAAGGSNE